MTARVYAAGGGGEGAVREGRRLGMVFAGDARDLRSWSGTPAGLAGALVAVGCDVRHVDADVPRPLTSLVVNGGAVRLAAGHGLAGGRTALRRARWQARAGPTVARLRQASVAARLGRAGPFDAVVHVHGAFPVATEAPVATYDDLTVVQAVRLGYLEFARMPARQIDRRIELQREAFQRATACCTTSTWAAASVIADYGVPPQRVFAVGLGTNRPAAPPPARDWTVPRFLFVGKDWQRKNGAAVVAAFRKVRAAVPGAELHLVGDVPAVDQAGVTAHGPLRLAHPAERAAVDDLYRRATCFVMPSHVEPSAVAYVEAAGFGLPVIGTTVGGSRDLVGGGGMLVDPDDEDGLAAAMVRLCDPGVAATLGARAAGRAGLFAWPVVAARILAALGLPGSDGVAAALDAWAGEASA